VTRVDLRVDDDAGPIEDEPSRNWKRPALVPIEQRQVDPALSKDIAKWLWNAPTNAELFSNPCSTIGENWKTEFQQLVRLQVLRNRLLGDAHKCRSTLLDVRSKALKDLQIPGAGRAPAAAIEG
jgi:hypothetical protein